MRQSSTAVVAMALLVCSTAFAQARKPLKPDRTTTAERARGGGSDPNVTRDREAAVAAAETAPPPPPPEKARTAPGERPRQLGMCALIVDNWSPQPSDVFVDGSYRGTAAAWGELRTYALSGAVVMYARAANGTLRWGPTKATCRASYIWRIDQ